MDFAVEDLPGDVKYVKASGSMDIAGTKALADPLAKLGAEAEKIIFDMSDVDYIASVGIGMLIQTAQAIERRRGAFVIASPSGMASDVLHTMKIDMVIKIFPNVHDALAAIT